MNINLVFCGNSTVNRNMTWCHFIVTQLKCGGEIYRQVTRYMAAGMNATVNGKVGYKKR